MKALVLGATGHIGHGVVREFLAQGYAVAASTRRGGTRAFRDLKVDVVVGDLRRPGQLDEWMKGIDVVVDAAAPKPLGYFYPPRGGPDPIGAARRRSHEIVVAVERTGARLAFVSSFSTLPRPKDHAPDPGWRWRRGRNVYFQAKRALERPLIDAGRRGLPIVVVNPTAVFGPWETCPPDESVVARILAGKLPLAMRHVVNVVDVRDVAAGIRAALEAERYGVQTPMSAHDTTLDDLVRRIAAIAGVAYPSAIDARFAVAAGVWVESVAALMGRPAPTAVCAAPVVADAWPMGTSAELTALGVEPRPLEATLRDAVRWRVHAAATAT